MTVQWAICFIGVATAVICLAIWAFARHRRPAAVPDANPGLIQPDTPPGPPGSVSPAMVGALLDGTVGPRDLFLTVIDLAVRGYLRLTPLTGDDAEAYDWALRRTDKPARGLRDFEATLLDAPVAAGKSGPTATLSSLIGDAQDALAKGLAELRGAVARAGWFTDSGPTGQRRASWAAGGSIVLLLGLAGAAVALVSGFSVTPWPGLIGAALIVASGILLVSLSRLRPTTTPAGDRTRGQVQRYRTWLEGLQPQDITPDTAGALFDNNIVPALAFSLENTFAAVFDTASTRYRNWGGALAIATDWLETPVEDLAGRVRLLDQLLDDAVRLTRRAGLDEPDD